MKNKRGFTLVELLATLAILSIILLIGTTSVTRIIKKNRQKLYDSQIASFVESAKLWAMDNTINLPNNGEYSMITYGQLVNQNYIKGNIENPITGDKFDNNMIFCIKNTNGNYTYELGGTGNCSNSLATNHKCFSVNGNSIVDYYNYIDNNVNNSICPKDVVISNNLNNVIITSIGSNAFKSKGLNSVVIPNSIISIGADAFNSNPSLTTISIDNIENTITGTPWGAPSTTVINYTRH